ncbi:MAG: hypothetical protein K1X83_05275 [Oligoflexia bacterium]|nr:hypothetical protein [Oligoflexia bacterium]
MILARKALVLAGILIVVGSPHSALPQSSASSHEVRCPPFIAERAGGLFYPKRNYACFPSARAARKAGLAGPALAQSLPDYTGWWRLGFKKVSDSCSGNLSSDLARTTIFLEIRQDSAGLYGTLCPNSATNYSGVAPPLKPVEAQRQGFSVSTRIITSGDTDCAGGDAETVNTVEARNFDQNYRNALTARFISVKSCVDPGQSSFRCARVYEGQGGRETPDHRFWPDVPTRLEEFSPACQTALTKCSGCHGELPGPLG